MFLHPPEMQQVLHNTPQTHSVSSSPWASGSGSGDSNPPAGGWEGGAALEALDAKAFSLKQK